MKMMTKPMGSFDKCTVPMPSKMGMVAPKMNGAKGNPAMAVKGLSYTKKMQ